MKSLLSGILTVLLLVAMAAAGYFVARSLRTQIDAMPQAKRPADVVGRPAPTLSVPALAGGRIDLAHFRGRTLVLNFWASWCGPCIEEMPELDRFAKARGADGFSVVGIAVEDAADARAFLQRHPVSYPIGLGSAGSPDESSAFGNHLNVLPFSVLIGPDGIVHKAQARTFDEGELDEWVRHP